LQPSACLFDDSHAIFITRVVAGGGDPGLGALSSNSGASTPAAIGKFFAQPGSPPPGYNGK